jgi:hypothetical protein
MKEWEEQEGGDGSAKYWKFDGGSVRSEKRDIYT